MSSSSSRRCRCSKRLPGPLVENCQGAVVARLHAEAVALDRGVVGPSAAPAGVDAGVKLDRAGAEPVELDHDRLHSRHLDQAAPALGSTFTTPTLPLS